MAILEGLGFEFAETMSGWLGVGETDPVNGRMLGERDHTPFRVDCRITISDPDRFLNISKHTANLTGTVNFDPLGGAFTIRDGVFNLFSVDPVEGIRHMTYAFRFTADDGKTYFCQGHKKIKDDPGPTDVVQDTVLALAERSHHTVAFHSSWSGFKPLFRKSLLHDLCVHGRIPVQAQIEIHFCQAGSGRN
jgi:hypothetical protein